MIRLFQDMASQDKILLNLEQSCDQIMRMALSGGERQMLEGVMKLKSLMVLSIALVSYLVFSEPGFACALCNIHNYLAESIQSSSNIYTAKVVRASDERMAEVEVIKVLLGDYKPGDHIRTEMYGSQEYVGQQYIFSDPRGFIGPSFEVLPLDYEEEILFLLRKDHTVSNLDEAIKCIQGVSIDTQEAGQKYINNHKEEAVQPLITRITELAPTVFAATDYMDEYRLSSLSSTLINIGSPSGDEFILNQFKSLASVERKPVIWTERYTWRSTISEYLDAILTTIKENKGLAGKVQNEIHEIYPKLKGRSLTEYTMALVHSEMETPDSLESHIKDHADADYFALGLYMAAVEFQIWWVNESALKCLEKAEKWAEQVELRKIIKEDIKDVREELEKQRKARTSDSSEEG